MLCMENLWNCFSQPNMLLLMSNSASPKTTTPETKTSMQNHWKIIVNKSSSKMTCLERICFKALSPPISGQRMVVMWSQELGSPFLPGKCDTFLLNVALLLGAWLSSSVQPALFSPCNIRHLTFGCRLTQIFNEEVMIHCYLSHQWCKSNAYFQWSGLRKWSIYITWFSLHKKETLYLYTFIM